MFYVISSLIFVEQYTVFHSVYLKVLNRAYRRDLRMAKPEFSRYLHRTFLFSFPFSSHTITALMLLL